MKKNQYIFILLVFTISLSCASTTTHPSSEPVISDLLAQSLEWQGRERNYWIHLPPENKMTKPIPILFHLHGGGGTAQGTPGLIFNRFNKIADREGFIVVYPDAVAKNWNDGRSQNLKLENKGVDDVGFIVKIIDRLKGQYKIDDTRIFTVGMSNGGFMSTRLLCDRADLFRGGAILTASISEEYLPNCNPERPVAILVMNGTDDPLVPYNGGDVRVFRNSPSRGLVISNDDFVAFWKDKNGCSTLQPIIHLPDKRKFDGTTVSIATYSNCKSSGALIFYKINGGGHTWPGGKQYLGKKIIGNTCREINACDEIWDFFSGL